MPEFAPVMSTVSAAHVPLKATTSVARPTFKRREISEPICVFFMESTWYAKAESIQATRRFSQPGALSTRFDGQGLQRPRVRDIGGIPAAQAARGAEIAGLQS